MSVKRKFNRIVAAGSAILFALVTWSMPSLAQDDGALLQVAEVKVKSSHLGDFIDLQRQMAEAGRAAGRTGRNVWQVMHGRTNTFHIVEPRADFAAYDAALDPR